VFEIPGDHTGVFIYPSSRYRGNVRWTIELLLDTAVFHEPDFNPNSRLLNVYGIEMVQIPEAAFTIGEVDTAEAWNNYALFTADENGRPGGLWKIDSEMRLFLLEKKKENCITIAKPLFTRAIRRESSLLPFRKVSRLFI
jgi:hypothetical protein